MPETNPFGVAALIVEQGMASLRAEAAGMLAEKDARIAELEREADDLREQLSEARSADAPVPLRGTLPRGTRQKPAAS